MLRPFDRTRHERSSKARRLAISLLFLSVAPAVHALNIERSETHYADKRYQFQLVATLDAPVANVEAVLRDYEGYPTLDARILEAHVLERPSHNVSILATTLRICFGPVCRNVKRVERVEESVLELAAFADPARSDVKYGETRTMLSVSDGGTRVSYRTSITPNSWLAVFAGERWMLNTLRDATINMFKNVELRAQAEPAKKEK